MGDCAGTEARLKFAIGAAILVVRAVQLHPIHRRPRRYSDRFSVHGGAALVSSLRAILGARLRKHFYARDPFRRIGLLTNVLRNLDAMASLMGARPPQTQPSACRAPIRPPHDAAPARLTCDLACADAS